jgi:hypothetical protein
MKNITTSEIQFSVQVNRFKNIMNFGVPRLTNRSIKGAVGHQSSISNYLELDSSITGTRLSPSALICGILSTVANDYAIFACTTFDPINLACNSS